MSFGFMARDITFLSTISFQIIIENQMIKNRIWIASVAIPLNLWASV